jgi:chemotaxis protein CheZ
MASKKSANRKARKPRTAKKRAPARKAARTKAPVRPAKRAVRRARPAAKAAEKAIAGGIADGVEHLARIIADAKRDLAAISARDIRAKHLPTAGDELTAIVGATEAATHAILDAVERIEKAAAGSDASSAILAEVTAVYEACNFQDITGQRISKIVSVLQEVDRTVAGLLDTLDLPAVAAADSARAPAARTGDAALLNGPQMPESAPNQADIDALFDKA